MDLTPGERAILSQLRDLYASTSRREHPLATITRQWPAIHVEAYKSVLKDLVGKKLVEATDKGRAARITDAGMLAIGVADVPETKTIDLRVLAKGPRPTPRKASPTPPAAHAPKTGSVGRIGLIAIAAAIVGLAWWLS